MAEYLVCACVWEGITYYGVLTRAQLRSYLRWIIKSQGVDPNPDVGRLWTNKGWWSISEIEPYYGVVDGSTTIFEGPCRVSDQCKAEAPQLANYWDGKTDVKVEHVIPTSWQGQADVDKARRLFEILEGNLSMPTSVNPESNAEKAALCAADRPRPALDPPRSDAIPQDVTANDKGATSSKVIQGITKHPVIAAGSALIGLVVVLGAFIGAVDKIIEFLRKHFGG